MAKQTWSIDCETCSTRPLGVFCKLEKFAIEKLSYEKVSNRYKKGQVIFLQGNPPFGLYCINNGKVKITKAGLNGKETIVRIASAGDLLGHRSLLAGSTYAATATVLEDTNVCFINKKTIYDILNSDHSLALELISQLSENLGIAESKITSMAQRSVRERFAELLLVLNENFGNQTQSGRRLDIKLTREEMASMIGTTPESLIRLVTEFKSDGFIRLEGKVIFIEKTQQLEDLADLN